MKRLAPFAEDLPEPVAPSGFARTGLHLDLRIQVPPFPALRRIARQAARFGFNTLLVEWEASYPYREHPILANRFSYTRKEIRSFLEECDGLGLEVIPLQQCFGHIEYILRHERYAHLRESEKDFCQLCPSRADDAIATFETIFADLADTHQSPYFHIGGDETYLLGSCPACRPRAERRGKSRLYVDYFRKIAAHLLRLGKKPIVWADMLLRYPDAAARMPRETIFMDWNYGWAPNAAGDLSRIRQHRFEFWGAAAMRCGPDNHSLVTWRKHFENLRDFPPFARQSGYQAMILTSWSTSGLYGYQWESGGEVQKLFPQRRVYPIGGFHLLLAAFEQALQSGPSFNPRAFVEDYAVRHFGISRGAAKYFWKALSQNDAPARWGSNFASLLKAARASVRALARIRPMRHSADFAHLRLMADLRLHHVRFKVLESRIQSPWFTEKRRTTVLRKVQAMRKESRVLDRRFAALNKRDLHPAELEEESAYRSGKLRELFERLSRRR